MVFTKENVLTSPVVLNSPEVYVIYTIGDSGKVKRQQNATMMENNFK